MKRLEGSIEAFGRVGVVDLYLKEIGDPPFWGNYSGEGGWTPRATHFEVFRMITGQNLPDDYEAWKRWTIENLSNPLANTREPPFKSRVFFREFQYKPGELKEIEVAVLNGGHQPWRLDWFEVVKVEVRSLVNRELISSDFNVSVPQIGVKDEWSFGPSSDGSCYAEWKSGSLRIHVSLRNSKNYRKGIWYVTSVSVTDYSDPEASR